MMTETGVQGEGMAKRLRHVSIIGSSADKPTKSTKKGQASQGENDLLFVDFVAIKYQRMMGVRKKKKATDP